MKKPLPLLFKNALLLLLFGLPGILGDNEVNHLQSTIRQNKATLYPPTSTSVDDNLKQNGMSSVPRLSETKEHWSADFLRVNPRGDPTQNIGLVEQSEEEDEEEDTEKGGQTTTVHMPTYFSYSTTRRANFRDRATNRAVDAANNSGLRNKIVNSKLSQDRNQNEDVTYPEDITSSSTSRNRFTNNKRTQDLNQNGDVVDTAPEGITSTTTSRNRFTNSDRNQNLNQNGDVPEGITSTSTSRNRFSNGRRNQDSNQNGDVPEGITSTPSPRNRFTNGRRNQDSNQNGNDPEGITSTSRNRIPNGRRNQDSNQIGDVPEGITSTPSPRNRFTNGKRYKDLNVNKDGSNFEDITPTPTSASTYNKTTMTFSSDILRLNTTSRPTSRKPSTYSSNDHSSSRNGRILTGRKKVNQGDVEELSTTSVKTDGSSYLERIQQQLQGSDATTASPASTSTTRVGPYHDVDTKGVEYKVSDLKKKGVKKDLEGSDLSGTTNPGGKAVDKQQLTKESTLLSKQDLLVKMKDTLDKTTNRPEALDEKFSTIIDTLSKGSVNVQSNIDSHKLIKNITLNNEPGTNLLETDSGSRKETNEKREVENGGDMEADNNNYNSTGGISLKDVIPVIIRNSVVAESVSDLVNNTGTIKFPQDVGPVNGSIFVSSTSEPSIQDSMPHEDDTNAQLEDAVKNGGGASGKGVQSKPSSTYSYKVSDYGEDSNLELKKKMFNLKKPLIPSNSIGGGSSGKVEDVSNGTDTYLTPFSTSTSTTTPSFKNPRGNEQQNIRVSSSTSRISSTYTSSSRIPNSGSSTSEDAATTFASNNMENNILTTSVPILSTTRFRSPSSILLSTSTPRFGTSSTAQPQPASTGENLIKQITSFNSRKRPENFFHPPSSASTSEDLSDALEVSGEIETFSKTEYPTFGENNSSTSSGHRHSSSISPYTSNVKKIVPWSTRLQKSTTTSLPDTVTEEITTVTVDYSDETTTPHRSSTSPGWLESSSSTSSEDPPNQKSTTFGMPTATSSPPSTSADPPTSQSPLLTHVSSVTVPSGTGSSTTDDFSGVSSSSSESSSESPTIIDLLDFVNENTTNSSWNLSSFEVPQTPAYVWETDDMAKILDTSTEHSSMTNDESTDVLGKDQTKIDDESENGTSIHSSVEDEGNWELISSTPSSMEMTVTQGMTPETFENGNVIMKAVGKLSRNGTVLSTTSKSYGNTSTSIADSFGDISTSRSTSFGDTTTSRPGDWQQNVTTSIAPKHISGATNMSSTSVRPITTPGTHDTEDLFDPDDEDTHTTTTFAPEGEFEHGNEDEEDKVHVSHVATTVPSSHVTFDNMIVKGRNGSQHFLVESTTKSGQRNNFISKISSSTEKALPGWTTLHVEETTNITTTAVKDAEKITVATTPYTTPTTPHPPTRRPAVTRGSSPDQEAASPSAPQYMGLSLIVKGSTMREICDAQPSLKKAIMFLFRNTTGRVIHNDQIVFPNLNADDCENAGSAKSGLHNIDLILYNEKGSYDDDLNQEFKMLWQNNGLGTNIAIHEVYLLLRPSEDSQSSGMTIAVIVIASIGLVCLLLFFILMMVLRKRQKKFNYGQRCTPVSLDDYSLDNISVYNSIRRKNARRASKRSYGNPAFDDPSAPSHPMNFAALAHFSTNRMAMDDEFSEIPMFNAKIDELLPGAETKNRYANVIPLPETRVTLSVREGDDPVNGYINANYVKGPKGAAKYYIACQAPMQSTVNDFWRMIWEQQSKLILMLTDLHENGVEKCFDYLPPSEVLDCHRLFGDYQVTLKKREVKEKYVISHLQLKNLDSNLWREVTHLWYTSWPYQGVPSEGTSIIAYLIEARSHMRHTSGPHVVHCSPGVGRTGTVLAIDLCIREFEISRMVDVPKVVYGLRRNRAGCVQTKDQYAFIYMVLNVYGTKLTGGALDSM